MAYLALNHLSFSYPDATAAALADVSLEIGAGEFVVLCGTSGCGKTTLLRQLKPALTPAGERSGSLCLAGRPLEELTAREDAERIGFLLQDPDSQIVAEQVYHELAFGLENLGLPSSEIRLRVAEMASFFGIQDWFHRPTGELSGGQKQTLNLAAIMALRPELLLLDEPTSQLDPIAAANFLATLRKVNEETGTTILLSEHRLEDVLPLADRVLVMEQGRLIANAAPEHVGALLREQHSPLVAALPTPIRLSLALDPASNAPAPTTVREGRTYLEEKLAGTIEVEGASNFRSRGPRSAYGFPTSSLKTDTLVGFPGARTRRAILQPPSPRTGSDTPSTSIVSLHDIWFRYERNSPDVLRGLDLNLYPTELAAIVGANGAGKTTILGVIAGLLKPYRGRIQRGNKHDNRRAPNIVALPQDPRLLFTQKTVRAELEACAHRQNSAPKQRAALIDQVAQQCEITSLFDRHPFDISSGEAQRVALADALLARPELLLLDEPTKGMDALFKERFAEMLHRLIDEEGISVLMVSHDIEFCARAADRCCLCFDGQIITEGTPRQFFTGMTYYTTAARRISQGLLPDAITLDDVLAAL